MAGRAVKGVFIAGVAEREAVHMECEQRDRRDGDDKCTSNIIVYIIISRFFLRI